MDDPLSSRPPTLRTTCQLRFYASLDASDVEVDVGFQNYTELSISYNLQLLYVTLSISLTANALLPIITESTLPNPPSPITTCTLYMLRFIVCRL